MDRKELVEATHRVAESDVAIWLAGHAALLSGPMDSLAFERLCTDTLNELIGHRAALAVIGRASSKECVVLQSWNFGCPVKLFERMTASGPMTGQPTLARWLDLDGPLFIEPDPTDVSAIGQALASQGLQGRALHGILDGGGMGSVVVFFGLRPDRQTQVTRALRLIAPYLHATLLRLHREDCMRRARALTHREQELLQCVVDGLTNPDIAKRWGRSRATVRNTLSGLMAKLNVSTRTELAVLAIQTGLLG